MRYVPASVAMLASCLGACALGPDFKAPVPIVPPAYEMAPHDVLPSTPDAPSDSWWHEFHDAELDRLEERTRQGNLDLQAGLLRIVAARAQVQVARSQGLPSLGASASYNREQLGIAGILKARGSTFGGGAIDPALLSQLTAPVNLYEVGFDAAWELDLFGKVRRGVEAAKAQSEATIESRNDMQVSLAAEVAQTYMQLRAAQQLQSITLGLIEEGRQVLELTSNRQAHGLAQQTDVESARAQVASLEATLPQYVQNIAVTRHALAVLMGQTPEALDVELAASADLPALPPAVAVGLPSTLARRRPDIRQAEATLHAATADIGVSVASLYPSVSLTGSAGLRNTSTRYLFDWSSKFYSAGPKISLPIFQGGALIANIEMARAEAAEAALNYRQVVLSALQEVEDGLVDLDQDGRRVTALEETAAAAKRSFDITAHSYRTGLTNYITVLNVETQQNQARLQLAQASLTELTDLVKLYKALGGGWQSEPAAVADATDRPSASR